MLQHSAAADLTLFIRERRESPAGVVHLALGHPDGGALPGWLPGAHIALILDGQVRYYSLTGDCHEREVYRVAVRVEERSTGGSRHVFEHLHVGEPVSVRLPRNAFPMSEARNYVFVAGGIGITPLYAMAIEADRHNANWELFYGARDRSQMAFLDELRELADHRGGLVHVLPEPEAGKLPLDRLIEPRSDTLLYCCGPEALLDAVEDATEAWPAGTVHLERYSPRKTPRQSLRP